MAQTKLLRFLQKQTIDRLGGNLSIHVNVRIIAATNRNLSREVKKGRFREDLFYRLNVIPIQLPPLRERARDIHILAQHFLERFSKEQGGRAPTRLADLIALRVERLPPDARRVLQAVAVYGDNADENAIRRMVTEGTDLDGATTALAAAGRADPMSTLREE